METQVIQQLGHAPSLLGEALPEVHVAGDVDTMGVFAHFLKIKEPGSYCRALAEHMIVKPQAFKEPIVFYLDIQKKEAILYKALKDQKVTRFFREGELKGVHPPGRPDAETVVVIPVSGKMVREAVITSDFREEFFKLQGKEPKEFELSYSFVNSVGYVAGDPWAIVAASVGTCSSFYLFQADPGIMNRGTSVFSVVTGPVIMLSAIKGAKIAHRIGDHEGEALQRIRLVRGVLETVSGVVMAGVRTVGLIATRVTTSKTVMVANNILGWASTVTASVMFLFNVIAATIGVVIGGKFLYTLAQKLKEGIDAGFQFILEFVGLNKSDMETITKAITFNSPEALYRMVKDGEKAPADLNQTLTLDEMIAIEDRVHALMATIKKDEFDLISDWDQVRDCLLVKALKEGCRLIEKKKAEYSRRAGAGSFSDIRKKMMDREIRFNGFEFVYDKKMMNEFACSMIDLARKEAHSNLFINTFVALACIIGIISFVGLTVYTGGTPLIVSFIALLVMNLMLSGVDFYSFIQDVESLKKTTKNDIVVQVIFLVMTIISIGVGVVFAQAMVPRLAILAIGALMLILQVTALEYSYSFLDKKEEEIEEKLVEEEIEVEREEDRARDLERLAEVRRRAVGTLRKMGLLEQPRLAS